MSFNHNDNNLDPISRTNYEEYFILYADNELSEKDRLAVEDFILAHPDLQAELDLFLSTKLPTEDINLENKSSLLADNMKFNAIDESLLLYLDNELTGIEKRSIEEKLSTHKNFELQYHALLKTKLEPEEIVYPYKKELYRYEGKRRFVFSAYWMRIAAAVIILLGMGIFLFTYQPKSTEGIVNIPGKTDENNPQVTEQSNEEVAAKTDKQTIEPTIKIGKTDDAPGITRHIEKRDKKENKIEEMQEKPIVLEQNVVAKTTHEKKPEQKTFDTPKENITPANTPAIAQQQTLNNKNVTSPTIPSLNDQTIDVVTAVQATVVEPGDEKKSKLKGFLRKATRFIERRTNISTTNENNELLIGAVAIQL